MRRPTMCGRNRIYLPNSGCDCKALTTEDIEALTPIECYKPDCSDSRACYGTACCMIVGGCESSSNVCEAKTCEATVMCA